MKIYLQTLGCPKNVVDSEILLSTLDVDDVTLTTDAKQAECIIINTCAFLLSAREEAIETIFDALRLKQAGSCKHIVVVGCLPQKYKKELEQELPEIDFFFDELDFVQIGRRLKNFLRLSGGARYNRYLITPKHYAYLKIAEGCDNRCSYCTIPSIKGRYRSRSRQSIINEADQLVDSGVRELILIAQDTTSYGRDEKGALLADLIRGVGAIDDLKWLRLMYTHPAHLDHDVLQEIRTNDKLCKYIDLPIQHISDSILRSMNRRIRSADLKDLLSTIRSMIPDIAIRTSVIVGYPGESDKEYIELRDFLADMRFERLGVFKYSREEDTPAADLDDQVPEHVKDERVEELMYLQESISLENNQRLIGRVLEVVIDEFDPEENRYIGRTQWDCPEIDNRVIVKGDTTVGSYINIEVQEAMEYDIVGSPVDIR
ncbi:30S ribosomal protein S12 methylthiotransferase RimO [candidate division KSB1 bacterium]|nr:30S ribosomal protein S12 methylthiotransferase RimO [candidate division KSB1 bacterium]